MKPGIYTRQQLTNEQYHASEGISKSGLDLIARSPAHFAYSARRQPTRAMHMGTALHTAVLEPDRFAAEYMLLREVTDRRSSAYKEAVKTWGADNVLTGTEADKVAGMQESVHSNQGAVSLLTGDGECELSVYAIDPETGLLVKCRFDRLQGGIAVDLKKTQDVRASEFSRSVAAYRYHVQHAFYADVYEWATGERLDAFKFLAVEESMPHANRLFNLDDESIQYGRSLYREALNTYAECVNANEWPGIVCEEEVIGLPSWAINQWEDNLEITTEDSV